MREFPQMLYRAEGANIANRLVNNEAEAQAAAAEGWGDRATAKAASKKPAGAATGVLLAAGAQAADRDAKRNDAELAKLNEALAASKEAADSARAYAQELGARVDTLEGFLRGLAADEGAPEQLRADITALLGGEGEAPAGDETKPAKKKAGKK